MQAQIYDQVDLNIAHENINIDIWLEKAHNRIYLVLFF